MAVDDTKVIDVIGTETASGDLVLSISDHLDWTESVAHQLILQEKINFPLLSQAKFWNDGPMLVNAQL